MTRSDLMKHWLVYRYDPAVSVYSQRGVIVTDEQVVTEYRAAGHMVIGPFVLEDTAE